MKDSLIVPLCEKYTLSIPEASAYLGICEKKLYKIINEHSDADFILCNGSKYLIKRKKFEQYIDDAYSI